MWNSSSQAQQEYEKANREFQMKVAVRNYERKRKAKKRATRRKHKPPKPSYFHDGRIDYRAYIDSPDWKAKRLEFIAAVDGRCETCGTERRLQVHHRHYKTLGQETQKDVKVQCYRCHQNTHEKDGILQDDPLSKEFKAIIG